MGEELLTRDALFNGRLVCTQFKRGYRFSADAVLAAHFCRPAAGDLILDLGCGSGIIGLILAFRHPGARVTGLEVQEELARLARENFRSNGLESRASVIHGSLREITTLVAPESFDLVVSNPPYRKPGSGRLSPTDQRARARHEIDASLSEVARAASFALKNRGRAVFVYPATRLMSLAAALQRVRLEPKRLQPVYSYPGSPKATLVLVEALKNGGEEVQLLDPFYIHARQNGPYSDAIQTLYDCQTPTFCGTEAGKPC
ncbi:MAG TPA: methyltransferase [Desulfobulbaceae bacterium]|nr:methyltransferase [Desulfobulbaceae bacterium]